MSVCPSSTPRPWPQQQRPAALSVDGTRPPAPNRSSISELLFLLACPFPERATNGTQFCDCEPDALNTPARASSRFQGVARHELATTPLRLTDRRLTLDRCLDQAAPAKPAT